MCGIPQSSRVMVTACALRDQRASSACEGDVDRVCAAAVEASAAQIRISLLKEFVIAECSVKSFRPCCAQSARHFANYESYELECAAEIGGIRWLANRDCGVATSAP